MNSAGYTLMGYSLAPGSGGVTGTLAGFQPVNVNGVALLATPSTSGTFTANLDSNAAILTGAPSTTNYTDKSSVVAYDDLGNPVTLDSTYQSTLLNTATTALSNATGVNLDNEMSQMLDLENSYSATAKLISTIDTMFSTLLTDFQALPA